LIVSSSSARNTSNEIVTPTGDPLPTSGSNKALQASLDLCIEKLTDFEQSLLELDRQISASDVVLPVSNPIKDIFQMTSLLKPMLHSSASMASRSQMSGG
jgi:hypothetical protein